MEKELNETKVSSSPTKIEGFFWEDFWQKEGKAIPFPSLSALPSLLPVEGAVRIELSEGIPIFKASNIVQERIEKLLQKNQDVGLTEKEEEELDRYEEIDDYLSFINRVVRNIHEQSKES